MYKSVWFRSVKLGDRIYQNDYYAPDKWREVTNIKRSGATVSLGLGHTAHDTIDTRTYVCGYSMEGITVQRQKGGDK